MKQLDLVDLEILNIDVNSNSSEIEFKISKMLNGPFETSIGLVNAETFIEARVLSEALNSDIEKSNQTCVRLEDSEILYAKTNVKILSSIDEDKYDLVSSEISSILMSLIQNDVLKIEVELNE